MVHLKEFLFSEILRFVNLAQRQQVWILPFSTVSADVFTQDCSILARFFPIADSCFSDAKRCSQFSSTFTFIQTLMTSNLSFNEHELCLRFFDNFTVPYLKVNKNKFTLALTELLHAHSMHNYNFAK